MSISDLIAAMTEAGAPLAAIQIAVRAIEEGTAATAAKAARKAANRRYYVKRCLNKTTENVLQDILRPTENILIPTESAPDPSRARVLYGEEVRVDKEERKEESKEEIESLRDSSKSAEIVELFPRETAPAAKIHRVRKPKAERAEAGPIVDLFIEGYANLARSCGLPACRAITNPRIASILARAKDLVEVFEYPDAALGFAAYFARIRGSPHLVGNNQRGWRANLDWILTEVHFVKIMEGQYEKTKQGNGYPSHNGAYR